MRILHVVAGLAKIHGGTSEVVPRLCEALAAAGDDVRLVTCEYGELSDAAVHAQKAGVDLIEYPRTGIMGRLLRYSSHLAKDIDSHVKWADVVHMHGLWQSPCWIAGKAALKFQKPYCVMTHGFLEPERLKISKYKKKLVLRFIERKLLRRAKRIVATADSEAVGVRQVVGDLPEIAIVPIGLDTGPIDAATKDATLLAQMGVPVGKKTVLYFSRITPIKGLDMLADAWARVAPASSGWYLLIVGPDDRGYKNEISRIFKEKCVEGSWAIQGPIFGEDKFKLLKSVDLFVLPTRSENFGIAVQEALAAGIPVICTKGAPWASLNGGRGWGRCGWWVDISSEAIAEGLKHGMQISDHERLALGLEGKKLVLSEFKWGSVAQRMHKIYQDICSE